MSFPANNDAFKSMAISVFTSSRSADGLIMSLYTCVLQISYQLDLFQSIGGISAGAVGRLVQSGRHRRLRSAKIK